MKHAQHKTSLLAVLAIGMLMLGVAILSMPSTPAVDTAIPESEQAPAVGPSNRSTAPRDSRPHSASGPELAPPVTRSTAVPAEPPPPLPFSALPPAPEESISRPSEATALMRMPLASQEFMPDGLPASALRCTRDGGVYTCGSCRTDGDCPPGKACLPNRQTRRFECLDTECEEDVHCFPGFVCRTLGSAGANAPPIRRCVPEGLRQQGEPCDVSPLSPQGTCREGLRCVLGVCGVPCRPDDPASCPTDQLCEEGDDGPACVADCRGRGCPGDQRCKQLEGSQYQCLRVDHGSCPETPCPESFHCNRMVHRGRAVFWCGRTCDPSLTGSCPEGEVCGTLRGRSTCYRQCDASDPGSCGEGWTCASGAKDLSFFGCMPDFAP